MKLAGHLGLAGLAAIAALGLTATTATAATTTIRSGSATGSPYSGSVSGALDGSASVTTSLGTGSCTGSTLTGSTTSAGALSISAATFSGCSSSLGSVTITPKSLPWSGTVTYNPVAGGKDADVAIKVSIQAQVSGLTCTYGGTLSGAGYNPTNAARPDTSATAAQIKFTNASVPLTSGFLCPSSASLTALYKITGAGGVNLWVTS